ncbi:MAG TPA: spermidine synthase [Gammaproteobacteria bacterium]|nr:spermidine synthase [Gammaproteobacteria bacterium]
MKIYGEGRLIHRNRSDEGTIEVVDTGSKRALHFGTFPRQSCMSLITPDELILSYTQAMMAGLIFQPKPKRILIIGLGGGSLVKFLLHHFSSCHIDVVELRQDVVNIAQRFFMVPVNHPQLNLYIDEGYHFVQKKFYQDVEGYDMILVDAYDHQSMADSVSGQAFFDACSSLLQKNGVMGINLWGGKSQGFHETMVKIKHSFCNHVVTLPVEDKGNIIAFGLTETITAAKLKKQREKVIQLEKNYQIGLPRLLQVLIRRSSKLHQLIIG